jgi:hypothetical protein
MGRWKPKGKPPVPAWAADAPRHLTKEIVTTMPKYIPPYAVVEAILAQFRDAFAERFGRPPAEGEPIFFDRAHDTPTPVDLEQVRGQISEKALLSGVDPAFIHAFQTVGLWVTLEQVSYLLGNDPDAVFGWLEAVRQHRAEFPPDA